MRHNKSADKKPDYGFERRQLKIAQSGNGVAGRASAGVSRSEADQNSADEQNRDHFRRRHGVRTKNSVGHQFTLRRVDSHLGELFDRFWIQVDIVRGRQIMCRDESAEHRTQYDDEVPTL